MAKTTKDKGQSTPVLVMDPPEPDEPTVEPEPEAAAEPEPAEPAEPADSTYRETASREDIERKARAKKQVGGGFFARLTPYTPADWERMKIWCYRLAPITDRLAGGSPRKFISVYQECIDEQLIKKEHGSGKYRLILNRYTEKNECIGIDSVEFEIEDINYPPKVPPGEWVDDVRNKRWAWAKEADEKAKAPAANGAGELEMLDKVMGYAERMHSRNDRPDRVVESAGIEAVKVLSTTIQNVIKETKPAPPPPQDNTMLTLVMKQLDAAQAQLAASQEAARQEAAGAREREMKLLEKMFERNAVPVADPLRDLAMDLLKKKLEADPTAEAAARESRMNGTQELIAECVKALAPPIDKALGFLQTMAANKQPPAAARPPGTRQPTTTAAPGQTQPPPAQQQTQPPPASEQPEVETITPEAKMEVAKRQVMNTVLNYMTPTLLDHLANGDGSSFGFWFCGSTITIPGPPPPWNRVPGVEAHKFAKQFGKEAITAAYKGNVGLWQEIAPDAEAEAKFSAFLDEFLTYDPTVKEEEEEAE